MKKIPLKLLLLFITIVFILSCHKESNNDGTIGIAKISSSEIVPINTARNAAFLFAEKNIKPFQRGGSGTLEIGNEESVVNDTTPYFYIFNFKNNNGFVIVSAEKREHPILAYSDKGNFNRENAPEGIVLWIETTKENIDNIRKGLFNTKKQTDTEWKLIGKETSPIRNDPADPGCQDHITVYTVGPFLATSWGQGCYYNAQTTASSVSTYCYHCPTGCVPTAMAQIMRYWQKPTSYNWASIPNTVTSANSEVARLMYDAGAQVSVNYQPSGSGSDNNKIASAMTGTFGYSSAQLINYNSSTSYITIQDEINASRPVLLGGSSGSTSGFGHAWVCDGYRATNIYWCNGDGTGGGAGYLQFHMNWGWNGDSDGYYSFDTWAPSGSAYNFQYARKFVVIHP